MKYQRIYDGSTLVGYRCDKGYIELHYYDITPSGQWHIDYITCGYRFSKLKDAKKELENN